ncbi:hypothetical protein ACHAW6_003923 [Cyclotella cf. meneghiniana]
MDRGLVISPSDDPCIACYPDADFTGLYGHEDSQDPPCTCSHTGFLIAVFNCPIVWKSKLQMEIALSTMEAEYVALSTSCKDLFPIVDMIHELCSAVSLDINAVFNMHIKIHENNGGALTLASLQSQHMTPRSKHYTIKYHCYGNMCIQVRSNCLRLSLTISLGFLKGTPCPCFHSFVILTDDMVAVSLHIRLERECTVSHIQLDTLFISFLLAKWLSDSFLVSGFILCLCCIFVLMLLSCHHVPAF